MPQVLLINPKITSARSARFPLSLLALAGSLQGKYNCRIVDGNMDRDYLDAIRRTVREQRIDAAGITVMGGPQVRSAIQVSAAIREASPATRIIWGGYFPTLYSSAAINAPYVDYLVRGQGEEVFSTLLDALFCDESPNLEDIAGVTWKRNETAVHNVDQAFSDRRTPAMLPYDLLGNTRRYLVRTFLGQRTAAYQAALGCRFRCTFCGVASMFRGATVLPPAARLERDLTWFKDHLGADSLQFFDHNFFDREADMAPILQVLAKVQLPWWCYARADALLNLSADSWALVRKSKLRMAYIGAESGSDLLLKNIRKGTRIDQTLAVAELCRTHGVIPELSFMVAPPHDPEGETERTFEFIRTVKRVNPDAEIIIYIYTPLPAESMPLNSRSRAAADVLRDLDGNLIQFPKTPEEWTEQRWVDYSCHADAPWMTERLRRRIRNFVTVLGCRFPTVQDVRSPAWTKVTLRALASWRYRFRRYDRPWELALSKRLVRLADPRVTSI
ncbi:MAG TPA: radical SAM protein [Steroidobacteraceae bacterium]|jgi:anaerobic magnesium-protoporphyrin IX monomethyl ester cyclase|nr:radical SAM protein [Steroidobacteraceae bacterium]